MKYLYTTASKTLAISIILLFVFSFAQAQKNTDSPYSRYGIGLINTTTFNGNFGMGGAGIAWRPFQYKPLIYDSLARSNAELNDRGTNQINGVNPASFSNISLTTFEAALISRNARYTSGSQSRVGSNTQLSHMSIAFPIGEKLGVGFGIRPYSFVGYDYSDTSSINNNKINYTNEGSGGINEIFVGVGYGFLEHFSVGLNAKYYFGKITDDRRVVYGANGTNFFNVLDQREVKVSSVALEIGAQYFKDLNSKYRLVVGAIISPNDQLNAEQSRLVRNYTGDVNLERFKDTSLFVDDQSVDIANNATYGIGVSIEKKLKWMLTADFKAQSWGDQELAEGIERSSNQLIHVGFDKYVSATAFGSYWERIGYRAGMRYNSSLLRVDNEDISEFGISFGLTLPLRKTFSTLNIGVEVGQRGKDELGLTKEEFFNFQVGVVINDKWFIKRKYD